MEETKECRKCKEFKNISLFRKGRVCKKCNVKENTEYYNKNRDRVNEKQREYSRTEKSKE